MKRFYVKADVLFFSSNQGGRFCVPVGDGYAPYLRIVSSEIVFPVRINGMPTVASKFEITYAVELELTYYPQIDYSSLIFGITFELVEGPKVIGNGKITSNKYEREVG